MTETIENALCSFCGCLCDDIEVEVEGGEIARVRKVCSNGRGLFMHYDPTPRQPTVDGEEVSWEDAVAEAVQVLEKADSPLIYGLSSATAEAQRKAIELADWLGAIVDTTSSVCHGTTGLALQTVGEPTCTLGEVRNRADLLVFWGCNPAASHPRHFTRYSVMPKGRLTPNGRRDRTVVAVDVRPTGTTRVADIFLQIKPGADFEVLTTLRALVQGRGDKITADAAAESVGGIPIAQLQDLADRMTSCRFGVAFMGMGLTQTRGRDLTISELFTLVAELNEHTRFSVMPMRGHGNVAGADQVMAWQTGYPFGVSYARGYPVYGPGEFSAVDVVSRREADAALILASDPVAHWPAATARELEQMPTVVLDPMPSLTTDVAHVVFPTAQSGVDATGTAYRMDSVPIRLRAVLPRKRPTDEEILDQIVEAMR
jgi:formylmethanofuran dehydrogenase subunit B